MHNHTTKINKYELTDQWYPCTPYRWVSNDDYVANIYTKFIIYAPFGKAVNFRKEFNIKH